MIVALIGVSVVLTRCGPSEVQVRVCGVYEDEGGGHHPVVRESLEPYV